MTTIGQQCRDPLRGGILTQKWLGELLRKSLTHAGYSGAAISDWERSKSRINAELVLFSLVTVLKSCQGPNTEFCVSQIFLIMLAETTCLPIQSCKTILQ